MIHLRLLLLHHILLLGLHAGHSRLLHSLLLAVGRVGVVAHLLLLGYCRVHLLLLSVLLLVRLLLSVLLLLHLLLR